MVSLLMVYFFLSNIYLFLSLKTIYVYTALPFDTRLFSKDDNEIHHHILLNNLMCHYHVKQQNQTYMEYYYVRKQNLENDIAYQK